MIDEGSRVLLVGERGRKYIATARGGMLEVGKLGVIDGDALRRLDFGDTMTVGGKKFTVIRPSLVDIVELIERKAQIMMPKDSFQIPSRLDLGAGSRVIEAGVGSGALTVVLLRAVFPEGRVFSYELREDHAAVARRNVAMTEHGECWQLRIADICTADLEKGVDAALLDIPNPEDAMMNVVPSLRAGGRICSYVPNVNQLQNAVNSMIDAGMEEVTSHETLQREMVVHKGSVRPSSEMIGHTGYLVFGRKLS